MKQKTIIGMIFGGALVLGLIAILSDPGSYGLGCIDNGFLCANPLTPIEGLLFLSLSVPLLIISPILFFVRREVFIAWAKFVIIAFPLMLGILLYTFNNEPATSGLGLGGLIPDELLASVTLPALFLIISLLLIGIKSWKLRGK